METINKNVRPLKVVITGPECTGKSKLTAELAKHFGGVCIEEYAREYILQLNRAYNYQDVEIIARQQVSALKKTEDEKPKFIFLDTYLIITKVWFEVVFGEFPQWIEDELLTSKIDLYLLCAPDLPWEKDPVRENGGPKRIWLYQEYEKNLIKYNFAYKKIDGFGASRTNKAIEAVNDSLTLKG